MLSQSLSSTYPDLQVEAYDPAVEKFEKKPNREFELVTSFDVLEHVERDSIHAVIQEIKDLSSKLVFLRLIFNPLLKDFLQVEMHTSC